MPLARRSFLGAAAASFVVAGSRAAHAQGPLLRIVVPFTAGSGTDVTARVIADALGRVGGRTVIVENKPGAGSVVGSLEVMRSTPDGNVVLYTTGGYTTNAVLMKKLPFDPVADFAPVTMLSRSSGFALLVPAASPYRTMQQFIAAAKAEPGKLTYGSSGIGNTTHVMGALFCRSVGIDLLHIPFKGTPTTELIGGTVNAAFLSPSVASAQIHGGQLRALGISGNVRSSLLPDAPTFAELGLKVQDIPAWSGFFGPARTPPAIVRALYESIAAAARTPAVKDYLRENGGWVETMPPEQFKAYVDGEIDRYRTLLPPLGIEMS